jgi:hypothetical protein
MIIRKNIATTLDEYLIEKEIFKENTIELFKDKISKMFNGKIEGRILNKKQAEELQKEIESNYTPNDVVMFGKENKDIRTNIFNYENPIAEKTINGINLKIIEGLIRNNKKNLFIIY